jgi:DNA repair exonuclease SbcCD ATPase subunit
MSEEEQAITPFCYDDLDAETRAFVQQKTDEIHGQLKRTAEGVISIGQNLREVKERLGHGHFLAWIETEFDMTPRSAQRFMSVAETFVGKYDKLSHLPTSILYELTKATTPETIVQGVLAGTISPTLQAVRDAREAERQAQLARQEALAEQGRLQQQLEQERAQAQEKIEEQSEELECIQQELLRLSTPSIQIKEVPVIPDEVKQLLEGLQAKIQTLTQQRNNQSRHIERLTEQIQAMADRRQVDTEAIRIRGNWRSTAQAFSAAMTKLLTAWPTPVDTQEFEAVDWNRLSEVTATCYRVLEACSRLKAQNMIVDTDSSTPSSGD